MDIRFLKHAAFFIKENYEPWKDLHEDDMVLWLLDSWNSELIFPMVVGTHDQTEIIALYQFWMVSPNYLRKVKDQRGVALEIPNFKEGGDKLFCPLSVIGEKWQDPRYKVSWMINQKVGDTFPEHDGYHRWVLQNQRVKFIKFRR